jgi:aconitate hydratase
MDHRPADGEVTSIYDAAMAYRAAGVPARRHRRSRLRHGLESGLGGQGHLPARSPKAVIAESFERIHRSNLVMMGVLPLEFRAGESPSTLGIDGTEVFEIDVDDRLEPRAEVTVRATKADGGVIEFKTTARVDTPIEVEYLRHGGILHYVLRQMASA